LSCFEAFQVKKQRLQKMPRAGKNLLVLERFLSDNGIMNFIGWRKVYHLLAVITLLGQIFGLIFCGDADCLQGSPTNDCVTLVCSLLGKHTAPASAANSSSSDSCQCFCHQLIDLPKLTLYTATFGASAHYPLESLPLLSTPVCNTDRPPSA